MEASFSKFFNTEFIPILELIFGSFLILLLGLIVRRWLVEKIKNQRTAFLIGRLFNWMIILGIMAYVFANLDKYGWINKHLMLIGDIYITPLKILQLLLAVLLGFKISKILKQHLLASVYVRYDIDVATRSGLDSLVQYGMIGLILLISMNVLGISLSTFNVFASVLGIGIGFGLRNIMNNMVSGLIILFDKSLMAGDRVIMDGDHIITTIEKIKIRHTVVRTRLGERIIIPNSYFLENRFVNRSYEDKEFRVEVSINLVYGSDLKIVETIILQTVEALRQGKWKHHLTNPRPRIFVEDFAEYSIKVNTYFWLDSQENEVEFLIPSDFRKLLYQKFNEQGIEFAFPRQDIKVVD